MGIREAMGRDHQRLEALAEAAFEARVERRYAEARATFAVFTQRLRRHVRMEEELVLPEFVARVAMGDNATAVVRSEHHDIDQVLRVVESQVHDPEAPVELAWAELRALLREHCLKADLLVYPALDRLLSREEAQEMVARARAWLQA